MTETHWHRHGADHSMMIRTSFTCVLCIVCTLAATAGCGEDPVTTVNQGARVTSVGPISPDDRFVSIQYTLHDREADDQDVAVDICAEGQVNSNGCMEPVQGIGGDGTSFLPTVPADSDVPHRFSWHIGCGLLDDGQCKAPKLDQNYVVRIRVSGTDSEAISAPFTLGDDLQFDSLPACDASFGDVPSQCSTDNN